jgi:hypothetical protein
MGRRRRSQSIYLSILLVALACQGLTPDPNDITSDMLLRLLCSGPADSSAPVKDCVGDNTLPPSGVPGSAQDGDRDGLPDEVCGPARPSASMLLQASLGARATRLAPPLALAPACLAASRSFEILSLQGRAARSGVLIHALCRLTC